MVCCRVSKVDAVAMLDATKLALDELGRARIAQSQGGGGTPNRQVVSCYAEVRRLRDFVQRSIAAFSEEVDLDLSERDKFVLVACFRRCAERIDVRMPFVTDAREREWLAGKCDALLRHAMEFASYPLFELPLPRIGASPSVTMRSFQEQLTAKFHAQLLERTLEKLPAGADTGDLESWASSMSDSARASRPGQPLFGQQAQGPAARGVGAPAAFGVRVSPIAGVSGPSTDAPKSQPFDVQKVRDPRLRALLGLDVRGFERAVEAADYRIAAVHLASILECFVLDAGLPRAAELGLPAGPEEWDMPDAVLRLLGEQVKPQDRAMAQSLFAVRTLVRPSTQLAAPVAVTAQSLQQLMVFVQQVLHALGFQPDGSRPEA
jgi:hypothetical protein